MKLWPSYGASAPPGRALGPALAAGVLVGLKSQLYFMGGDGWAWAGLRLPLGMLAGAMAGALLAWGWKALAGRQEGRPAEAARRAGWALWGLLPLLWLGWEIFSVAPALWLVPAALLGLMLCPLIPLGAAGWALAGLVPLALLFWGTLGAGPPMWLNLTLALGAIYFVGLWRRLALEPLEQRPAMPWVGLGLAGVLALGLGLRLAGLDHAWPDYICHVDAPKQASLLPAFLRGELAPPINYLVSHIYLYAALQGLLKALSAPNLVLNQWAMGQEGWMAYVLAARGFQAALGACLPLLGFLTARRLWGAGAGLLAGFLLAVDPLQMTYSRQLMSDVPQVIWVWLSFFFAVRILQEGRWWDYLLAGLAAGAAVAAKIYGGYVVLLALAAWGLRRPWPGFVPLGGLAAGIILGCLIFSPLFWLEPARWWNDLYVMAIKASPGKHLTNPALGLWYALKALLRRFGWAWVVLSGAGLIFVGLRHRRADLLALLAGLLSLALVGVRLSYLREWDLVNLTPFLSLSLAALLVSLLAWLKQPAWRGTAIGLVVLFLVIMGFNAVGDAWLARLPDTGQMARRWVGKLLAPDQLLAGEYPVSKGRWLLPNQQHRSHKWDLRPEICRNGSGRTERLGALVMERFWWDHPLPQSWLRPVQVFASRNYYWENPDIAIYLPRVPDFRSQVIPPHVRVALPGPAYLTTPWAWSRPRDLLVGSRFAGGLGTGEGQWFITSKPLGSLTYVALGRGRARLYSTLETADPLDLAWDRAQSGRICPARRLAPWRPRNYGVRAQPHHEGAHIWVGLYARPEAALPVLMRAGDWAAMQRAAARLDQDAPPEAQLMAAAAQVQAGHRQSAEKTLARLQKEHPSFLKVYQAMATAAEAVSFTQALNVLTTANRPLLYWERLCWPCRVPGWPEPKIARDSKGMRLTLAQPFLPGLLRLSLELAAPLDAAGRLVISSTGWEHQAVLAQKELPPGSRQVELAFEVPKGPVALTIDLRAPGGKISRLVIDPDLQAEYAWRWQVLSAHLAGLTAWPKE